MSAISSAATADKVLPSVDRSVAMQGSEKHMAAEVDVHQKTADPVFSSEDASFTTVEEDADTSIVSIASGEGDNTVITIPDSADDAKFPASYLEAMNDTLVDEDVIVEEAAGQADAALATDGDSDSSNTSDTKIEGKDINPYSGYLLLKGTTRSPKLGHADPELLKISIEDKTTGTITNFQFKNISHDELDWNSKKHIAKINSWRRQIFRRAGFGLKKQNVLYQPDEDAFLMLFWAKIKAVATVTPNIGLPNIPMVEEAFNAFFVGHVIQDKDGNDLFPRAKRDSTSIQSKFARVLTPLAQLRKSAQAAVKGRTGATYIPFITDEEVKAYRETKAVKVDNPTDATKNAALNPKLYKSYRKNQNKLAKAKAAAEKTLAKSKPAMKKNAAEHTESEGESPVKETSKKNRNFKDLTIDTHLAETYYQGGPIIDDNSSAADVESAADSEVERANVNKTRKPTAKRAAAEKQHVIRSRKRAIDDVDEASTDSEQIQRPRKTRKTDRQDSVAEHPVATRSKQSIDDVDDASIDSDQSEHSIKARKTIKGRKTTKGAEAGKNGKNGKTVKTGRVGKTGKTGKKGKNGMSGIRLRLKYADVAVETLSPGGTVVGPPTYVRELVHISVVSPRPGQTDVDRDGDSLMSD